MSDLAVSALTRGGNASKDPGRLWLVKRPRQEAALTRPASQNGHTSPEGDKDQEQHGREDEALVSLLIC